MPQPKEVEVIIPSVGESITEASIGQWFFKDGEWVEKDSILFELETDKATVEVTSPESGRLSIKAPSGKTVPIGALAGLINVNAVNAKKSAKKSDLKADSHLSSTPTSTTPTSKSTSPTPTSASPLEEEKSLETEKSNPLKGFSPSKRKAFREGQISLSSSNQKTHQERTTTLNSNDEGSSEERFPEERKPMSRLRQKIAERLMLSQKSTATLTTFNEVDLSRVMSLRGQLKETFQSQFGVKLGFMSFFVKALCHGREDFPIVCARIDEKDIVYSKHLNVSIAVSTERGLVVPVLRKVENLSYADIEKSILDISEVARQGKLTPESMLGGNITLSNGGVFGSLLSTPILNPPQSAILGMHKTEMRAKVVEVTSQDKKEKKDYKVEIRPMMYLALSYDHRLIDGKDSVGFLIKVKEYLENVNEDQIL